MNLYKRDSQHYIAATDVQSEMNMNESSFELLIDQFEHQCKSLEMRVCDSRKSIPCKMAWLFMQWYLEHSYTKSNSLVTFCRDLKPYCKKIPKRQLSRSMRVEIAYRQEYKCRVCDLFPIPPNFEVDHIIELQDGGADISENFQALCPACHAEKTRLNRLRKNEMFHKQAQAKYETFIPQTPGGQIFSKYFSKNAL